MSYLNEPKIGTTFTCGRCKKTNKEVSFNNGVEIPPMYSGNNLIIFTPSKLKLCNSCTIMFDDFLGGETDL